MPKTTEDILEKLRKEFENETGVTPNNHSEEDYLSLLNKHIYGE